MWSVLEWKLDGKEMQMESEAEISWIRGINLLDLDSLLRAQGLLHPRLRQSLITFHGQLYESVVPLVGPGDRPHISQLLQVVHHMVLEGEQGMSGETGIRNALASVYRRLGPQIKDLPSFSTLCQGLHLDSPSTPR